MSEARPEPLTPADCDLTDFKFMPLECQRLRDSDLASEQTPEENWAAVLLWTASWHQVPAASLPDVDATIAKLAGYMMRGRVDSRWKDVKRGAMRGFVLCADGRWYHPVVAEKAREAWISKLKQRLKTECGRIKKHNERHGTRVPYPEFDDWLAAGCPTGQPLPVPGDTSPLSPATPPPCPPSFPSKGQGEGYGQGQGQGSISSSSTSTGTSSPPAGGEVLAPPGDDNPGAIPACDHQAVLALWRQHMPTNPQPVKWTDTRRRHLQARWRELFAEGKATTRDSALAWFAKFFRYLAQSAFLTGRSKPQPGRPTFFAELDWILSPENFAKCIEGKYHPTE